MGIRVSGPVAQNALATFDKLWIGARCADPCATPLTTSHLPEVKEVLPSGEANVFSLYRDHYEKNADKAVEAALSATTQNVHILQNRYFQDAQYIIPFPSSPYYKIIWLPPAPYPNPEPGVNGVMDYSEGILNALENDVNVTLIVSGDSALENKPLSAISILNLLRLKMDRDYNRTPVC
jgi:hypothetical protein